MTWQPIDTAPKDVWVLVSWKGGLPEPYENGPWDYGMKDVPPPPAMTALWRPSEYCDDGGNWRSYSEDGGFYGEIPNPTHWMPLPEPPRE